MGIIKTNLLVTQSCHPGIDFSHQVPLGENHKELLQSLGLFRLLNKI